MIVSINGREARLPDFLIVGAAKSGTTSLHYYLKQHPQIFMPKKKELNFFTYYRKPASFPGWESFIVSRLEDYIDYYREAKEQQVLGEACPNYLYEQDETINNIKTIYGEKCRDLKVIIILRNPIERAWSHYVMKKRDGKEDFSDFKEAIKPSVVESRKKNGWKLDYDYIGAGLYYQAVRAFLEEFNNVKIIIYEDFSEDNVKAIKDIFLFLTVNPEFEPSMETRYNVSGSAKSTFINTLLSKKKYPLKRLLKALIPLELRESLRYKIYEKNIQKREMPYDIRSELELCYRQDIFSLQDLLQKDLSYWLTPHKKI